MTKITKLLKLNAHPIAKYLQYPLKEYQSPESTGMGISEIEQCALEAREICDYKSGGKPVDVARVLGRVDPKDNRISKDDRIEPCGAMIVHGLRSFNFILPWYTGPLGDRVTVAHMLGHYFLHSDQGKKKIIATELDEGLPEREANTFAFSFLMPEEEVRKEFQECSKYDSVSIISILCSKFGTRPELMEHRLELLDIKIQEKKL